MKFQTAALVNGAAVFFSVFVAATLHSEEAPEPVTVVFYNLKNYLAMERRVDGEVVEDAPKPEAEVRPLVEGIVSTAPDVLAVCEIGDRSLLADLQKRLGEAGVDLPHTELVTAASGYNRNLAVLSRYPLAARNSRDDYSYSVADTVLPFQRGVLDVTIAVNPAYRLRCIGLHLKSKREASEADQALMRLNEARLARQHVDRVLEEEPEANLLVVGDLNALRMEPPVRTLQGSFGQPDYLASLTLEDRYGFRWTHHWAFADAYSRFDFALYSRGLSPEIERGRSRIHHWPDWDKASDHRPLVVRITPEER
ncbi:MAG: endonuclease/exonuclease/phosphatase family protein [Verrucomicrobiales bacterium]